MSCCVMLCRVVLCVLRHRLTVSAWRQGQRAPWGGQDLRTVSMQHGRSSGHSCVCACTPPATTAGPAGGATHITSSRALLHVCVCVCTHFAHLACCCGCRVVVCVLDVAFVVGWLACCRTQVVPVTSLAPTAACGRWWTLLSWRMVRALHIGVSQ